MTALRDRFGRRARWRGVGGFFAWWWRSLVAWLPPRWRVALGIDRGRVLLQADADAVQLRLQDGEGLRDLGHVPGLAEAGDDPLATLLAPRLADLPRWLLLPGARALRRRLQLPAAAAERLRDVVSFEIDRQTPFAADAVAFDARLLGRREGDGQLDVELVAVPRATLDAQLALLGPMADGLAGVDVAGGDGAPLGVNLLPPAQRSRQLDPLRRWNWLFAGLGLLALGLALWTVLQNREAAAAELERRANAEAESARAVSVQRQRLTGLVEGRVFLDRQRAQRPTAVEVLDELSRRLPDGTYLEKLAVEDNRLMLIGLSGEASSLVARLEGSRLWNSPALTGTVQPDPRTRLDRFTLTATLANGPATPARNTADGKPR
ncbi:MAG TPA: PilN domain-containing protein [Xanthomonadaceae bacterium]|nr:PilN domain-containing protein [Xanthomonadaceae bacterium]